MRESAGPCLHVFLHECARGLRPGHSQLLVTGDGRASLAGHGPRSRRDEGSALSLEDGRPGIVGSRLLLPRSSADLPPGTHAGLGPKGTGVSASGGSLGELNPAAVEAASGCGAGPSGEGQMVRTAVSPRGRRSIGDGPRLACGHTTSESTRPAARRQRGLGGPPETPGAAGESTLAGNSDGGASRNPESSRTPRPCSSDF